MKDTINKCNGKNPIIHKDPKHVNKSLGLSNKVRFRFDANMNISKTWH